MTSLAFPSLQIFLTWQIMVLTLLLSVCLSSWLELLNQNPWIAQGSADAMHTKHHLSPLCLTLINWEILWVNKMCPGSNTGYHLYSASPFPFSVLVSASCLIPAIIDYLIFPFSSHCSHNLDHTTLCSALLVFSSTAKTNPHIGKHFSHFWVSASLALAHLTAVTLSLVARCLDCIAKCHSDLKVHRIHFNIFRVFLKYNFSLKFS